MSAISMMASLSFLVFILCLVDSFFYLFSLRVANEERRNVYLRTCSVIRHDDMSSRFILIVVHDYSHDSAKFLNVFCLVYEGTTSTVYHDNVSMLVQRSLLQVLLIEVGFLEWSASISVVQWIVHSATNLCSIGKITEIT